MDRYSDTFTKIKTSWVGNHRAELPADIIAEKDVIGHEIVAARTGLSSYQALCDTLAVPKATP